MMVVPEGGSLLAQNLTQVVDGHTGVEHSLPVGAIYKDVTQLWGGTKVGYTPTLGVAYGGLMGEQYWYAHTDVWAEEPLAHLVPRQILDPRSRRREIAPEGEWNHFAGGEERQGAARRRRLGTARRPRPARRARRALGAVDDGAGRDDAATRRSRPARSPARATSGSTRTSARSRPASSPTSSFSTPIRSTTSASRRKLRYVLANGRLYDSATMNEIAPEAKSAGAVLVGVRR